MINLQAEVRFFGELAPPEQARLLALFLHELGLEARTTYGPAAGQVTDGARLRFVNEMAIRTARYIGQVLADEPGRPAVEILLQMLLEPRADKTAERFVLAAWRRALRGFEQNDETVTFTAG